jgi:hypothetical protein
VRGTVGAPFFPEAPLRTPSLLVAVLSLVAGAARAEGPSPQKKAANDVRAALAREAGPLEAVPFETPGGLRGAVPAAGAPRVGEEEGRTELAVPIGTAQDVGCTVFPERLDAAAVTWRMVQSVKGKLELLQARPVEVVAVASSPLVFSEIVYRAPTESGPMLGVLKLAVYAHDGHSLLCHHDEPGYAKTFQRVVSGLAASLEGGADDERAGARYADVAVVRIAGVAVGYAEQVVWEREGGGRVMATYEAQLMPRSPTDLVAVDSYKEEASDAAGLLLSGSYVHVTNGEIDTRIRLAGGEDGKTFRYEGEKQGKALQGSFTTKAGLATDHWFARRFDRKAGYGPKGEVSHEGYAFSVNPAGAMPISYRKDAKRPRRAELSLGALKLSGELDEHGLFRSAEIPVGPTKMVIERVWSRGAP